MLDQGARFADTRADIDIHAGFDVRHDLFRFDHTVVPVRFLFHNRFGLNAQSDVED